MTLEGQHLTVIRNGRAVLRDVSLTLAPGELVFLLGVNGAGKSTLLHTLAGLLPPAEGQVLCGGRPLSGQTPAQRARLVSLLHQDTPAYAMTVEEFVLLGAAPYLGLGRMPNAGHRAKALAAMERMGLAHLAHRPMTRLSGGERQRAALAQCLVTDAAFLLLDEPTASLDVRRQHEFLDLLAGLVEGEGKGALVSVHDPNLALDYAPSITVLSQGSLAAVRPGPDRAKELEARLQADYSPRLVWAQAPRFLWQRDQ